MKIPTRRLLQALRDLDNPNKKEGPLKGGARGVMVIVVGNEHGDTSLNPGRD